MRMSGAVLPLLLALAVPVAAQNNEEKVYTVTVSGEAMVAAVPDRAHISLTVQGPHAKKRREAEENQSRLTRSLVTALNALGVDQRAIKTESYAVLDYYEQKDNKNEHKGFYVVQQLSIRVPVSQQSAVLDAVPDFAKVQGVEFSVSNERQLRDQAVHAAIDDAHNRAKGRALSLGITLGPVLAYQEGQLGRPRAEKSARMSAAMADSAAPELPPGEDELHVSVSITYKILVE